MPREVTNTIVLSLDFFLGTPFSTPDRDHDQSKGNCAELYESGWWFAKCGISNLNGLNYDSDSAPPAKGIVFKDDKHGAEYSFPAVTMMIRPKYKKHQGRRINDKKTRSLTQALLGDFI